MTIYDPPTIDHTRSPFPLTDADRQAAARWLADHGHADLLPVLGLDQPPTTDPATRT